MNQVVHDLGDRWRGGPQIETGGTEGIAPGRRDERDEQLVFSEVEPPLRFGNQVIEFNLCNAIANIVQ